MFKVRLSVLSGMLFLAGTFSPAMANERFTMLTGWFAQAEHGGFYQAKAEGLYDEAGLDVEIRQGGPQVNGMQLLLSGQVDALMGTDLQLLQVVENGHDVVAVAAMFQYDPQGMMTHTDVKNLGDLKDKTILIANSARVTFWPWLKAKYGYTDAQTKPYTFNLQPFFADPNAAQQGYPTSEPFQAQQNGVKVNFFPFADDGYPPYGSTILVTRKTLEDRPQEVRAFIEASTRGWRDYMHDPARGNELIKTANPKMGDDLIAFGIARMRELHLLDGKDGVPIGMMTEARWQKTADYMIKFGFLKADTDWRRAFTLKIVSDLKTRLD